MKTAAQQALKSLRGYRREINCEQPCDAELRLAHWLELDGANCQAQIDAAAELRRLHAVNQELLEALVSFTKSDYIKKQHPIRYAAARAAIAKAEGQA